MTDRPATLRDTPARLVREAWAAGRAARNAWLIIPDAYLAELVAACGISPRPGRPWSSR